MTVLTRSPAWKPEPETGAQMAEMSSTSVALMTPTVVVRRRSTLPVVGILDFLGHTDHLKLVADLDAGLCADVQDDLPAVRRRPPLPRP